MKKLTSLFSALFLCGWMVGCAPEATETTEPAPETELEPTETDDTATDEAPVEDAAPEGSSVE